MAPPRYEFGFAMDKGAREDQQDAAGFTDPDHPAIEDIGFLGIVCDGMGGLADGATASQVAINAFRDAYGEKRPDETIPEALLRSIENAHRQVSALSREGTSAGGSTLVAAVLRGLELYWIGSGDSRAWLVRGETVTTLTVDHNVGTDRIFRPGRTYSEKADPGSLTSYMGSPAVLQVELSRRAFRLKPGDTIVLGSDGLYSAIQETDLVRLVGADLKQGCLDLLNLVLEQRIDGQDNVSILAMRSADVETGA
jgi:serine/threonine protein phosphatase PrpC